MSRAFVKEAEDESVNLPDRPISPHLNLVTPEGLAAIERSMDRFNGYKSAIDRNDRSAIAAAQRELRAALQRAARRFEARHGIRREEVVHHRGELGLAHLAQHIRRSLGDGRAKAEDLLPCRTSIELNGVRRNLAEGIKTLVAAGAKVLAGGKTQEGDAIRYQNTLLRVDGDVFLKNAEKLQTEAFGNESLFVVAKNAEQMVEIARQIEGNLTGCIYSHRGGQDDALYDRVAAVLRTRVGRLLNDKMPTGVAFSPAMNHGGPFPATGHPGFTAVGIPASLHRFAVLECYDNVRPHRLPPALKDENPTGKMWRLIDGNWRQS